jgi:hypothetical protein
MQTAAVRDDRDVIVRMHADVERFRGGGLHVESFNSCAVTRSCPA